MTDSLIAAPKIDRQGRRESSKRNNKMISQHGLLTFGLVLLFCFGVTQIVLFERYGTVISNPFDWQLEAETPGRKQRLYDALPVLRPKTDTALKEGMQKAGMLATSNLTSDIKQTEPQQGFLPRTISFEPPSNWPQYCQVDSLTSIFQKENNAGDGSSRSVLSSLYPHTSGCRVEQSPTNRPRIYCRFTDIIVDSTKCHSKAKGGEELSTVMGQEESDEFIKFDPRAFVSKHEIQPRPTNTRKGSITEEVMKSLAVNETSPQVCDETVPGFTLFVKRYEYVNLYHTMTDWWNVWTVYREIVASASAEGNSPKINVVFLDAHPAGNLDSVWSALFGKFHRIRHLKQPKTCFESAFIVPEGYISHLYNWPGAERCAVHEYMTEFSDFFLHQLGLQEVQRIPGRIVLIDRKPYTAHSRHKQGKIDPRALNNLKEVALQIQSEVPGVTSCEAFEFHHMSFRDQVKAVREASILIGNHGAGLTHLLFMDVDTHVIEFQHGQGHFEALAGWKARLKHHFLPSVKTSISKGYMESQLLPLLRKIVR